MAELTKNQIFEWKNFSFASMCLISLKSDVNWKIHFKLKIKLNLKNQVNFNLISKSKLKLNLNFQITRSELQKT